MSNVLKVKFGKETKIVTKPLYQYDYGQVLKFLDLDLPYSFEVHFSNYEHGTSITQVGINKEVTIPDICLQKDKDVYVWVYLHTGQNDGETEYQLTIPVIERASITNEEPTPQETSAIEEAIIALNSAVSTINDSVAAADSAAYSANQFSNICEIQTRYAEGFKNDAERAYNSIHTAIGDGYITIGSTQLTEAKLIKLLELIEED